MFAPFTRSMTFTLSLFSLALSPDLLAETEPEQMPTPTLELGIV
jgi:outer-membrane receptor for ferric coprogen and ferric-rhodotorulic acid